MSPADSGTSHPASIDELEAGLAEQGYIAERSLATAIFLALRLGRPLFLEGEAGVGKTEVAKVLATLLGGRLIRLQCHEGLDIHSAAYEWDYARQMLEIRLREAAGEVDLETARGELFRRELLLARPLLQAVEEARAGQAPPVLLIDELDRADEEFEAFLLELLADFQITIPEIGTLRAEVPPVVVLTSNRTREVHDALRRRCLYHWIDYPSFAKELAIVTAKAPGIAQTLGRQAVAFVQELRSQELYKPPGVAETLDWLQALDALGRETLSPEAIDSTLGALLKYQDDIAQVTQIGSERLLGRSAAEA